MQYLQDTTEGRQSPPKALQSPTPAAITSGVRHCVYSRLLPGFCLLHCETDASSFHTLPPPNLCNEGKRFFFNYSSMSHFAITHWLPYHKLADLRKFVSCWGNPLSVTLASMFSRLSFTVTGVIKMMTQPPCPPLPLHSSFRS